MLPETLNFTEEAEQPSLTFKIDFEKNKIVGKTDGLEAVKQAVFLMLSTERDYSEIYNYYGIKFYDLIGRDIYLAVSELKRRIIEILKNDNRILEVENFKFNEIDEGLELVFDVVTIYGKFASRGVFKV